MKLQIPTVSFLERQLFLAVAPESIYFKSVLDPNLDPSYGGASRAHHRTQLEGCRQHQYPHSHRSHYGSDFRGLMLMLAKLNF
jgi:hypothetical protein